MVGQIYYMIIHIKCQLNLDFILSKLKSDIAYTTNNVTEVCAK